MAVLDPRILQSSFLSFLDPVETCALACTCRAFHQILSPTLEIYAQLFDREAYPHCAVNLPTGCPPPKIYTDQPASWEGLLELFDCIDPLHAFSVSICQVWDHYETSPSIVAKGLPDAEAPFLFSRKQLQKAQRYHLVFPFQASKFRWSDIFVDFPTSDIVSILALDFWVRESGSADEYETHVFCMMLAYLRSGQFVLASLLVRSDIGQYEYTMNLSSCLQQLQEQCAVVVDRMLGFSLMTREPCEEKRSLVCIQYDVPWELQRDARQRFSPQVIRDAWDMLNHPEIQRISEKEMIATYFPPAD